MNRIFIFGLFSFLLLKFFGGKKSTSVNSDRKTDNFSSHISDVVGRSSVLGNRLKSLKPLKDVEKHFRHYRFDNLQALTALLWDKNGTGKKPTDEDIENRIIGNFIAENSHLYCLKGDLGFYHEYVKYPEPVVIDNISYNFEIARIWYCEIPNF